MPTPVWILAIDDPLGLLCTRCTAVQAVSLPMRLDWVRALAMAFSEKHARCQPPIDSAGRDASAPRPPVDALIGAMADQIAWRNRHVIEQPRRAAERE